MKAYTNVDMDALNKNMVEKWHLKYSNEHTHEDMDAFNGDVMGNYILSTRISSQMRI